MRYRNPNGAVFSALSENERAIYLNAAERFGLPWRDSEDLAAYYADRIAH
jgi:hypothetical protein